MRGLNARQFGVERTVERRAKTLNTISIQQTSIAQHEVVEVN